MPDNIQKNKCYEATVCGMTSEGNGVAKIDGFAVFIPHTTPGDRLRVKITKVLKHYAFGIIDELLEASPARCENNCPVFSQCGGCCYRHIHYEEELHLKEQQVRDAMERIGKITVPCEPICGSNRQDRYRNKALFPIGVNADGKAETGFFAPRSHRIIKSENCRLLPDSFNLIARNVVRFINKNRLKAYDEKANDGVFRHVYLRRGESSGEIMLCVVIATDVLPKQDKFISFITERHPAIKTIAINYNPRRTNVILGDKTDIIYGDGYITDEMCGLSVRISPQAFYQVNHRQAEQLYRKAVEFAALSGEEILVDLYCGIGLIGLSSAHAVKELIGVEIIPQAIRDAKQNALQNNIDNARFITGDAADAAKQFCQEGIKPDVVLLDPPRKGCDSAVLQSVCDMAPRHIVMISCNPSTAARDCAFLEEQGYQVKTYQPYDLFPRTRHVETVCLLSKLHSDKHIEVELNMDELDLTAAESKATYGEIKDYVMKHTGMKVSSLYIAQIKQKHGIIERENYNTGDGKAKVPQCPPEKEAAIKEALEYFRMI